MQREVSRKLYMQLPELSQHLDRTLARAPKDEYGPPPQQLWRNLVVSFPLCVESYIPVCVRRKTERL